jgi:hypothetical protein
MIQQYHSRIYLKESDTGYSRGTFTAMFIAALFTIARLWKKPRYSITDEWIKKMWYLYTLEFYAAMKKNEMVSLAGKWMKLENLILSEVSLAQETKIICSPSCADMRSRVNTTRGLDFDHMIKREHTWEV